MGGLLTRNADESARKSLVESEVGTQVHYGTIQNVDANGATVALTQKYWYRWYILLVFALFGLLQGTVWNTWSPIEKSAKCALGFTENEIEMLTNWGPILFLTTMPVFMWMLDRKGLRVAMVVSSFVVAIGTGLRCLPLPENILRYFIHAGQMLNGATGCTVMASPPLLSNVWFPLEERVTATSITTMIIYIGLSYLIGPAIVREPSTNVTENGTHHGDNFCNSTVEKQEIREQLNTLMYIEFGICLGLFLSILLYFPRKPPLPPSTSASLKRMDFLVGLKTLTRKKTYVIVTVTSSLVQGGYGGWIGTMAILLDPLHVHQNEAGNIGFYMSLAGIIAGIAMGRVADKLRGHIKHMIIALLSVCFLAYLYYVVISEGWINSAPFKFSHVGLWIDCIIIGVAVNASIPLCMEMGADSAYPASEAVSAGVIVWFSNLTTFVLVLVLQFTNPTSTNYVMLSFVGVSVLLLSLFAEEPMNRAAIDAGIPYNTQDEDSDDDLMLNEELIAPRPP